MVMLMLLKLARKNANNSEYRHTDKTDVSLHEGDGLSE